MAPRLGNVYPDAKTDGTVRYVAHYRRDGRQRKRRFDSEADAWAWLASEYASPSTPVAQPEAPATFATYAETWLALKRPRVEASTWRDYSNQIRLRLAPAFGALPLGAITRAAIESYLADLDATGTLSRKTINESYAVLRQVLDRAVLDGLIAHNAAAATRANSLKLPREAPRQGYLDPGQARAYLAAAAELARLRPAIYAAWAPLTSLLIGGGLRIGEALALDLSDLDLDAPSVLVARTLKRDAAGAFVIGGTKTDRSRDVAIDRTLADELRAHRRTLSRVAGPLFTRGDGRRLDHGTAHRAHHLTLGLAGLPRIRVHDLRHTAAHLWLRSGESIYFVQQQLGHRSIQTTIDLYGHPDRAAHRAAAERASAWRHA